MALQQALQQQREHEQQVKQAALGNADNIEFGSGIVKLYKAEGKKMNWVEQGVGMLVWWSSKFGDEQRFRCLRISDMHPILDEELYMRIYVGSNTDDDVSIWEVQDRRVVVFHLTKWHRLAAGNVRDASRTWWRQCFVTEEPFPHENPHGEYYNQKDK